jgi:hypothetical protein
MEQRMKQLGLHRRFPGAGLMVCLLGCAWLTPFERADATTNLPPTLAATATTGSTGAPITALPKAAHPKTAARIVVRGWEIQSVTAIRRPAVTNLLSRPQNGRTNGARAESVGAKRGDFLIVEVQCAWGTLDPLHDPLWVGRPDVTLIDDRGTEYPVYSTLTRESGEYVLHGMFSARRPKARGELAPQSTGILLCFDVPRDARSFWLRFSHGGPHLEVMEQNDLSDNTDITE